MIKRDGASRTLIRRVATAGALLACVAAPLRADIVLDPVGKAKAEIERICLNVEYPEDFARWGDITGDGRDDVIIRYAVTCDGYHSRFCGQSGCGGGVYVATRGGGFIDVGVPPDVEPTEWNGFAALELSQPGQLCGKSGPNACKSLRVWTGTEFARPTNALARQGPPEPERPDARDALRRARHKPFSGVAAPPVDPAELARADATAEIEQEQLASVQPESQKLIDNSDPKPGDADEGAAADAEEDAIPPNAEEWVLNLHDQSTSRAEILGEDGSGLFQLTCFPGDATLGLSFRPSAGAGAQIRRQAGVLLLADFVIGRRASEARLLAYAPSIDQWEDNVSSRGRLLDLIRSGSYLQVREPGGDDWLASFTLRGSSKALAALLDHCGL